MLDDLEVVGGDLQHIDDGVASGGVWRRCLRRSQGARCIGEELDDLGEGRGRVGRAKGECGGGGRGGSRRRGGWTRLTGGSWFCLARKRRLQTNANNAWPNALRAVVCTGASLNKRAKGAFHGSRVELGSRGGRGETRSCYNGRNSG